MSDLKIYVVEREEGFIKLVPCPDGKDLEEELERLRKLVIQSPRFEKPPCPVCGYNSEGYNQPDKHPCAKLYHQLWDTQEVEDV